MPTKTVWKVCRILNDEFMSASPITPFKLVYRLGEPTYPVTGTYLFAFDDPLYAEQFMDTMSSGGTSPWGYALFECETPSVTYRISDIRCSMDQDEAMQFWKWFLGKGMFDYSLSPAPKGSVLCESITPTKRII